jgi:hypothetical protein
MESTRKIDIGAACVICRSLRKKNEIWRRMEAIIGPALRRFSHAILTKYASFVPIFRGGAFLSVQYEITSSGSLNRRG